MVSYYLIKVMGLGDTAKRVWRTSRRGCVVALESYFFSERGVREVAHWLLNEKCWKNRSFTVRFDCSISP